jgi:hypothetical protein
MEKVLLGVSSVAGGLGSFGIFLAQVLPSVPDGYEDWRASAIFGFITLIALVLNYFIVCRLFSAIATLDKVAAGNQELNARLNKRPCLIKRDD